MKPPCVEAPLKQVAYRRRTDFGRRSPGLVVRLVQALAAAEAKRAMSARPPETKK